MKKWLFLLITFISVLIFAEQVSKTTKTFAPWSTSGVDLGQDTAAWGQSYIDTMNAKKSKYISVSDTTIISADSIFTSGKGVFRDTVTSEYFNGFSDNFRNPVYLTVSSTGSMYTTIEDAMLAAVAAGYDYIYISVYDKELTVSSKITLPDIAKIVIEFNNCIISCGTGDTIFYSPPGAATEFDNHLEIRNVEFNSAGKFIQSDNAVLYLYLDNYKETGNVTDTSFCMDSTYCVYITNSLFKSPLSLYAPIYSNPYDGEMRINNSRFENSEIYLRDFKSISLNTIAYNSYSGYSANWNIGGDYVYLVNITDNGYYPTVNVYPDSSLWGTGYLLANINIYGNIGTNTFLQDINSTVTTNCDLYIWDSYGNITSSASDSLYIDNHKGGNLVDVASTSISILNSFLTIPNLPTSISSDVTILNSQISGISSGAPTRIINSYVLYTPNELIDTIINSSIGTLSNADYVFNSNITRLVNANYTYQCYINNIIGEPDTIYNSHIHKQDSLCGTTFINCAFDSLTLRSNTIYNPTVYEYMDISQCTIFNGIIQCDAYIDTSIVNGVNFTYRVYMRQTELHGCTGAFPDRTDITGTPQIRTYKNCLIANCDITSEGTRGGYHGVVETDSINDTLILYNTRIHQKKGGPCVLGSRSSTIIIRGCDLTGDSVTDGLIDGGWGQNWYIYNSRLTSKYLKAIMVDWGGHAEIYNSDIYSHIGPAIVTFRYDDRITLGTARPSNVIIKNSKVSVDSLYCLELYTGVNNIDNCELTTDNINSHCIVIRHDTMASGCTLYFDTTYINNTTMITTDSSSIGIATYGIYDAILSKAEIINITNSNFRTIRNSSYSPIITVGNGGDSILVNISNFNSTNPIIWNRVAKYNINYIPMFTTGTYKYSYTDNSGDSLVVGINGIDIYTSGNIGLDSIIGDYIDSSNVATLAAQPMIDIQRYGFINPTTTTSISFDGDSIFTLTDAGAGWEYYRAGVKYSISGNKTANLCSQVERPLVDGTTYYIYIDGTDGSLTASKSPWTLTDTKVPVSYIVYNSTLTPTYLIGEERHSCLIDRRLHYYEHFSEGVRCLSVGALAGYTINSDVNADKVFSIADSRIADEDIINDIAAKTKPDGADSTYMIMYRTGASTWEWKSSNMPFLYNTSTDWIQWDNAGTATDATGGTGSNTRWVNSYVVLTNYQDSARIVIIPGQHIYTSLAAAKTEAVSSFDFSGFPIQEAVIVYRLTWTTYTSTSDGKCMLAAIPEEIEVAAVNTVVSGLSIDHNTLAGLQGGTTDEYYHLTFDDYTALLGFNNVAYVSNDTLFGDTNAVWDLSYLSSIIFPAGDYVFDVLRPSVADFGYVGTDAYPYQMVVTDTTKTGWLTSFNDTIIFTDGYLMGLDKIEVDSLEIRGSLFKYVSGSDSIYTDGDDLFSTGSMTVGDTLYIGNNKMYDEGDRTNISGITTATLYSSDRVYAKYFNNLTTYPLTIQFNQATNPLIRWTIINYDNASDTSMVEDSINGIRIYRPTTFLSTLKYKSGSDSIWTVNDDLFSTGSMTIADSLYIGTRALTDDGTNLKVIGSVLATYFLTSNTIRSGAYWNYSGNILDFQYGYGCNKLQRWMFVNNDNSSDTSMVEDSLGNIRIFRNLTVKNDVIIDSSLTVNNIITTDGYITGLNKITADTVAVNTRVLRDDGTYLRLDGSYLATGTVLATAFDNISGTPNMLRFNLGNNTSIRWLIRNADDATDTSMVEDSLLKQIRMYRDFRVLNDVIIDSSLLVSIIGELGYNKIQVIADTFDLSNVGLLLFPSGTYSIDYLQPSADDQGTIGLSSASYDAGYIDTIITQVINIGTSSASLSAGSSTTITASGGLSLGGPLTVTNEVRAVTNITNQSTDDLGILFGYGTNSLIRWDIRNYDDANDTSMVEDSSLAANGTKGRIRIKRELTVQQPSFFDSSLTVNNILSTGDSFMIADANGCTLVTAPNETGGWRINTALTSFSSGIYHYFGDGEISFYKSDFATPYSYMNTSQFVITDSTGTGPYLSMMGYDTLRVHGDGEEFYYTNGVLTIVTANNDSLFADIRNGNYKLISYQAGTHRFSIDLQNDSMYYNGSAYFDGTVYPAGGVLVDDGVNDYSMGMFASASPGYYIYNAEGTLGYFDLYVSSGVAYLGMYDYSSQEEWVTLTPGTLFNTDGTDSLSFTGGNLSITKILASNGLAVASADTIIKMVKIGSHFGVVMQTGATVDTMWMAKDTTGF